MTEQELPNEFDTLKPQTGELSTELDVGAMIEQLSPKEYEEYCLCKKSLRVLAAEAIASGIGLSLLSFLTCRAPLPMILAALELTQATGNQCAEVISATAVGTEVTLFLSGVVLSLIHNLVFPRIRLAWKERQDAKNNQ